MYIYDNVVILSSMWNVLRFEHAHGLKRYNDRRMTRGQTSNDLYFLEVTLVLDSFYLISFLQFLLPFSRKRLLLRWIVDIVKGIRSSLEELCDFSVKAVAIFLFLAFKSTLITVLCNENVPRLLLQRLRCYLSPLDVWWKLKKLSQRQHNKLAIRT